VYAFLISGEVNINGEQLSARDGLGIWATDVLKVRADANAELLLMEVPMN
jgi:redox-sensitive bicupin YhaK (pirin superfamily)